MRPAAYFSLQRWSRCDTLLDPEPGHVERPERVPELHPDGQVQSGCLSVEWSSERPPWTCSDVCDRRDCQAELERLDSEKRVCGLGTVIRQYFPPMHTETLF